MSGSGNWGKVRSAVQTFGPRLDEKEARIKDLMRTVAEQHHTGLEDEQRRTKVEQELRCVLFDDCCSRCGHALVRRGVVAVEDAVYRAVEAGNRAGNSRTRRRRRRRVRTRRRRSAPSCRRRCRSCRLRCEQTQRRPNLGPDEGLAYTETVCAGLT